MTLENLFFGHPMVFWLPMDTPKGPWGISAIKFFKWSQYQISAHSSKIQILLLTFLMWSISKTERRNPTKMIMAMFQQTLWHPSTKGPRILSTWECRQFTESLLSRIISCSIKLECSSKKPPIVILAMRQNSVSGYLASFYVFSVRSKPHNELEIAEFVPK